MLSSWQRWLAHQPVGVREWIVYCNAKAMMMLWCVAGSRECCLRVFPFLSVVCFALVAVIILIVVMPAQMAAAAAAAQVLVAMPACCYVRQLRQFVLRLLTCFC